MVEVYTEAGFFAGTRLSAPRWAMAVASVGIYVVFAGGSYVL